MKRLVKFGIVAALVAGVVKVVAAKKAEWQGLTETEVRDKLNGKLGARMPAEKVDELGDKIVATMRDRGVLREDAPAEEAPAEDAPAGDVAAEDAPADDAPEEDAPTGP